MDTYGGSLSDPMSLHKYLFANSNPVMYSDPSGQVSKAESVAVVTVMSVLAAEMNGILYVFKLDDNNTYLSKNDFYRGLWKSMLTAFVISFILGIITLFLGVIVGPFLIALIGGIVGLGLSFKEICQGVIDIINGKFKSGVMEIAFGIIGATASAASIYYGIKGIMSSDNSNTTVAPKSKEIIISDDQFGEKYGKHGVGDYGLSGKEGTKTYYDIITDSVDNPAEIRFGNFKNQGDCYFYLKNGNVTVVTENGNWVTTFPLNEPGTISYVNRLPKV